ncbi:hypothetical protein F2Q69_00053301 [Brassica cretica]|uniref:Uncharacterized protein n=1 Tax=Brassica cretica TaxID=69181 RepID=A0A8S9NCQ0_BRACR|nr:hypothetical protein F2Q69_00053301 [Brassica cretica]
MGLRFHRSVRCFLVGFRIRFAFFHVVESAWGGLLARFLLLAVLRAWFSSRSSGLLRKARGSSPPEFGAARLLEFADHRVASGSSFCSSTAIIT